VKPIHGLVNVTINAMDCTHVISEYFWWFWYTCCAPIPETKFYTPTEWEKRIPPTIITRERKPSKPISEPDLEIGILTDDYLVL